MKKAISRCWLLTAGILLTVLTAGCLSFDAESDHSASDITLQELLKRETQARDPRGIFAKATSYVQKQVQTGQNGEKQLCVVQYLEPDCLRITLYADNQPEQETILNGASGWQVDYPKRTVTPFPKDMATRLRLLYRLNDPDGDAFGELFSKVEISRCRIGDDNLYKLVCHPRNDSQFGLIEYIGDSSYLPRRMRVTAPGDMEQVLVEMIIDSYALFEDVMVPENIRRVGLVKNSSKVIEHHLNVPMKRDAFLPPVFPQIISDEDDE